MRVLVAASLGFLGLSSLLPSRAHSQVIQGRVIDPDGATISGALISLRTEAGAVAARVASGEEGRFHVDRVGAGTYSVVVERLGYQTTLSFLFLQEGDSIEVDLHMEVEAIPLEPITVTASPRPVWEHLQPPALWEFWERKDWNEKLGLGHFYTHEDLKPLSGTPVALAITTLAPFLYPVANSERKNAFHIQGRIGCPPLIFLDGRPLPEEGGGRPQTGSRFDQPMVRLERENRVGALIDDWISLGQVAAVEVYRGASDVPGEFRLPGAMCGAVVVWSLRGPVR